MQDDEASKPDVDRVDGRKQKGAEADPVQEATISTQRKKVRRKLVEQPENNAQVIPFEIGVPPIPSQEVSHPPLRLLEPDEWVLEPPVIEVPTVSVPSKIAPPRIWIWEEARLKPLDVAFQPTSATEIGLPPRRLFSVAEVWQKPDSMNGLADVDSSYSSHAGEDEEEAPPEKPSGQVDAEEVENGEKQLLGLDEFLFDISGGSLRSHEPLCIVAAKAPEEDYKQTLETVCREQFRQLRGGKPLANLLAEGEEDGLETAHVESQIISFDDESDKEYLNFKSRISGETAEITFEGGEVASSRLHARIDEFFTETLGYLLLFVEDEYALTLYDHLTNTDEIREPTQIRFVRPRPTPDDVKREIVRLAWGGVPIESTSSRLDRLFQTAEAEFKDCLHPQDPLVEVTAHNVGDESLLHYWIKCLVVEYLLKRKGLTPIEDHSRVELKDEILTEIQLEGGQSPIPDVYHQRSQEVFEVETLYGSHHKKITRTVDKYEGVNVKRVNIVLPNLALLRNLSAVLGKTQKQPGEMFRNEVKFWTLDVVKRDLIPLNEVTARLADLQERGEKFW